MPKLFIYPRGQRDQAQQVWPGKCTLSKDCIEEAREYIFELRGVDDVLAVQLRIDEIPLQALRPLDLSTALWSWKPGFHAGIVEVSLSFTGKNWQRFEIVTDPDVRKMTRVEFDKMVHELLEDTFALFSLSSFKKGISRSPSGRPPPIARLEFLHSRVEALISVVKAIDQRPQRVLRGVEITKPHHRARRVTGPEILKSMKGASLLKETSGTARLPARLRGNLPSQIKQQVVHSALDIREHREIKSCLKAWSGWLRQVSSTFRSTRMKAYDEELLKLRTIWHRRTLSMSSALNRLLTLPLFQEVSDVSCRPHLSSIYRRMPAYRQFFRLYRDFNAGLANIFGDFLQMPLARTFDLYELWCYMRIVRAAQFHAGIPPEELSKLFFPSDDSRNVTIIASDASIRLNTGLYLCFQKSFKEYWLEDSGQGSFSRKMVPDFTVVIPMTSGQNKLIVLDAKYRIEKNINEAISSIHMYRDALVEEDDNGIRGLVSGAYLLSPFLPELSESSWKTEALPGRFFHPEYRDKFRFGAATIKPGMELCEIWEMMEAILGDATGTRRLSETN
ncbi:unnamed protein product [Ectocarpus sp. 12 AP-2014]